MAKTNLTVKLLGNSSNAMFILGKVSKAIKRAGLDDIADEYIKEATKGDYNNLLSVTMDYVNVE